MDNEILFSSAAILIGMLIVAGCTGFNGNNQNPAGIARTCIGDCQAGQASTDGYHNHQQFTLNRMVYLPQPYMDLNPAPGAEWHNWNYLVLYVTVENLQVDAPTELGILELKDASGKKMNCFYRDPTELTTIYATDEIVPNKSMSGTIACVLSPDARAPFTLEYGFDSWYQALGGSGKHAVYTVSSYDTGTYAGIEKRPALGMPGGVTVKK
jgi:hypothetical protein